VLSFFGLFRGFGRAGHPSDEENLKTSKFSLEGLVSLVLTKGSLVFWVPPYILIEWMDGSQLLKP
jgi:hypothetical protein